MPRPTTATSKALMTSQLAQPYFVNRVVLPLAEDQVGSLTCRHDVLPQIRSVDRIPDRLRGPLGVVVGESGVLVEVGLRLLERGGAQQQESLDVPPANVGLQCVDVDAEVEEVRNGHPGVTGAIAHRL